MRVLQVINSIAPSRGGPTHVVIHLSRALAAHGATVHIIATRADLDAAGEAELRQALGPVRLSLLPTVGPPRLELSPGWLSALARAARGSDVAHVHTVFTYPVAVAPPLLRALRVPYLVRPAGTLDAACIGLRSTRNKRLAIATYVRRNLLGAARVHVTSPLERAEIAALAPRARIELIELGVGDHGDGESAPLLEQRGQRPDAQAVGPLRIGSLGRVHDIKRLDVLVRALPLLPGAELVLAGAGDPATVQSLRALASSLGVAERVRLVGHLGEADKQRFLAGCRVLAFPSLHESFGVAVAESLAAARPVVVSPEIGIAAELANAGAGVIAAAQPETFAAALAALLASPERCRRMGLAGQALARARWSWDPIAARTLALYKRFVRGRDDLSGAEGKAGEGSGSRSRSRSGDVVRVPSKSLPTMAVESARRQRRPGNVKSSSTSCYARRLASLRDGDAEGRGARVV